MSLGWSISPTNGFHKGYHAYGEVVLEQMSGPPFDRVYIGSHGSVVRIIDDMRDGDNETVILQVPKGRYHYSIEIKDIESGRIILSSSTVFEVG